MSFASTNQDESEIIVVTPGPLGTPLSQTTSVIRLEMRRSARRVSHGSD
jgi:hypothetical protein